MVSFFLSLSLRLVCLAGVPRCAVALAAETRTDAFGGTGLFAVAAAEKGDTLVSIGSGVVLYGAEPDSQVQHMVDKELIGERDESAAQRGAWSIAASIAAWKVQRGQATGLSTMTLDSLDALPWTRAAWQLPSLWSGKVLNDALIQGSKEATARSPEAEDDILDACFDAKQRTVSLKEAAKKLASGLATIFPELDLTALLSASRISLALVLSRSILHTASGKIAMLPVLDCANHAQSPVATFADAAAGGGVSLLATEDIAADQEITVAYGDFSASPASCFSTYGFVPDHDTAAQYALRRASAVGRRLARDEEGDRDDS